MGCENESIYRVWDPESKKVKRVAYSVIDDGQGLDDTHNGDNINNRVTWNQEGAIDTNTGSSDGISSNGEETEFNNDELDQSLTPQGDTVSRFFRRPTAMVTTRSEPKKRNEPPGDPVITPPRTARVHDQGQIRPKEHRSPSPLHAYEDTYVPRIAETLTASPFFQQRNATKESTHSPHDADETMEEDQEQEPEEESMEDDVMQEDDEEFHDPHSPSSGDQEENPEENHSDDEGNDEDNAESHEHNRNLDTAIHGYHQSLEDPKVEGHQIN